MNKYFNAERTDYIDNTEKELMSKLFGKVLDIGCGETNRSSSLILRNPKVTKVIGFDPLTTEFKTDKLETHVCVVENWDKWEGFDWLTVWYGSLNAVKKEEDIINTLIKLNISDGNIIIACHRRFNIPKNRYRIRWNIESLKGKYNNFNGGLYNRMGKLIKQYIKDAKLFKKTSNYEYWVRIW